VLQAADILLYQPDFVPVGEDQVQHIELTRDVAARFNNLFGEVFKLPKAVIPKEGARIMGLDDASVKMSKSIAATTPGHAINLLDDPRTVKKTIMAAVTDSERELRFEHASPGVKNLLTIYQVLSGKSMQSIESELEGGGYGTLKKALVDVVVGTLEPLQARHAELMKDAAELDAILAAGADKARAIASVTAQRAMAAMGVGA
jgi:tryptophanyl-tRNA synthetase